MNQIKNRMSLKSGVRKLKMGVNAVWAIKHMSKKAFIRMLERAETQKLLDLEKVVSTLTHP